MAVAERVCITLMLNETSSITTYVLHNIQLKTRRKAGNVSSAMKSSTQMWLCVMIVRYGFIGKDL